MKKTLGVVVAEPPQALHRARLDNIALVPASLLPLKGTYQPLANTLPKGSVFCVPATPRQQKILAKVMQFFREHGRSVLIMPMETITRKRPHLRPHTQNLTLPFANVSV